MILLAIVMQLVLLGSKPNLHGATVGDSHPMSPGIVSTAIVFWPDSAGGNGNSLQDASLASSRIDSTSSMKDEILAVDSREAGAAIPTEPSRAANGSDQVLEVAGSDEAWSWSPTMTGFFDVRSVYSNASVGSGEYSLGQVEVDVEANPAQKLSVVVAVAYNDETSNFEVGSAFVDMQLLGIPQDQNSPLEIANQFGIIAGQFDIPFGIDWRNYASIDRELISVPAICASTHGLWNDIGIQLYWQTKSASMSAYAVNGFNTTAEVIHEQLNLATGEVEEVVDEVDTTPDDAYGLRLAFTPAAEVELGCSIAAGINQSRKSEMIVCGTDCSLQMASFAFRSEFIYQELNRSIAKEKRSGFYLEATRTFMKLYIASRFGGVKYDHTDDWTSQLSLGVGYHISECAKLRSEYQIDNKNQDMIALQLAIGF